ncbi:MAG: exopolysaccharide biosynthesis polyprenyl glycosylphosphotransferase, partial [Pseudobdellovibrio sp.]
MVYLAFRFSQIEKTLLMIIDLLCFIAISFIVFKIRLGNYTYGFLTLPLYWITVLIVLSSLYIFGAYDFSERLSIKSLSIRIIRSFIFSIVLVGFGTFVFAQENFGFFGRGILAGVLLTFYIFSSGPRIIFFYLNRKYNKSIHWLFLVDELTESIIKSDIKKYKFQGKISYVDASVIQLKTKKELNNYDVLVLATKNTNFLDESMSTLMDARLAGFPVLDICDFYEKHWFKVPVDFLSKKWFFLTSGFNLVENPVELRIKRLVDLILALLVLLVVWPIMLIAALVVKLESDGEVIYKQKRVGKGGREFVLYKFRSMVADAEKSGAQWAIKNDSRITRIGKILRSSRIDELPQLFNVIKGEMSFIGPRPERLEFNKQIEKVVPFYNVRNMIRPGLTGWAQVCFPYGASIEDSKEKLQYEIYYIKNYSLLMDLTILLKTVSVVI